MKRFFFITFSFVAESEQTKTNGNGDLSISCLLFPKRTLIEKAIKNDISKKHSIAEDIIQVAILNIIELSERDFNDFI